MRFVPPVAVALGAVVIEKHITLDRSLPGPDHSASIEPAELKAMMQAIADVELLMGDGIKAPQDSELEARALVRRGLKASRDLQPGAVLTEADIVVLRPATGIAPGHYHSTLGKRLTKRLAAGDPIEAGHLE